MLATRHLLASFTRAFLHARLLSSRSRPPSSVAATGDDEWNDAWEMAWMPEASNPSFSGSSASAASERAPWESGAGTRDDAVTGGFEEMDDDMKAFLAEMDERWAERRAAKRFLTQTPAAAVSSADSSPEKGKVDDYRILKQRVHAALWVKEIEKMEESKLGGGSTGDDIDRLLDSCAEIFDADNHAPKIPNSAADFKTKPDGWETTFKSQDGNAQGISQREEDILLQEFERRIAFSKHQIASFIKTHIFSRRRPIDGWKYMIEEIGPNARKGKGSVQRLPAFADAATQPYSEAQPALGSRIGSFRGR